MALGAIQFLFRFSLFFCLSAKYSSVHNSFGEKHFLRTLFESIFWPRSGKYDKNKVSENYSRIATLFRVDSTILCWFGSTVCLLCLSLWIYFGSTYQLFKFKFYVHSDHLPCEVAKTISFLCIPFIQYILNSLCFFLFPCFFSRSMLVRVGAGAAWSFWWNRFAELMLMWVQHEKPKPQFSGKNFIYYNKWQTQAKPHIIRIRS